MKLKRILIIVLTISIIFSNALIGFAAEDDTKETYESLIQRVNTLIGAYSDKLDLAIDLYLVQDTLNASDYLTLARNWLSENPSAKIALKEHGLNETSITNVIDSFKSIIPTNYSDLTKDNPTNVFAKIYQNMGSSFDYTLYAAELKVEIRAIYDQLPQATKDALHKFDRDGDVPVEKVFVEIVGVLLNEKAGYVYYNTSTGKYYDSSYAFNSGTKDKIVEVLNNYRDMDPETDTSIANS